MPFWSFTPKTPFHKGKKFAVSSVKKNAVVLLRSMLRQIREELPKTAPKPPSTLTTLSFHMCPYLSLCVPICAYVSISVHICPYVSISVVHMSAYGTPVPLCHSQIYSPRKRSYIMVLVSCFPLNWKRTLKALPLSLTHRTHLTVYNMAHKQRPIENMKNQNF